MTPPSEFRTIAAPARAELRERGSRFLAYAWPVQDEAEIKLHLRALRDEYPDATHHCYAWVLGAAREQWRANDDGEPAHSAGTPILRQIHSFELTQVLVVVVRYFGGTKLGVPGLIQAYGQAAFEVLSASEIQQAKLQAMARLRFPFGLEGLAHRVLHQIGATVRKWEHTPEPELLISLDLEEKEKLESILTEYNQLELEWIN